jgi:hypothetical protein
MPAHRVLNQPCYAPTRARRGAAAAAFIVAYFKPWVSLAVDHQRRDRHRHSKQPFSGSLTLRIGAEDHHHAAPLGPINHTDRGISGCPVWM